MEHSEIGIVVVVPQLKNLVEIGIIHKKNLEIDDEEQKGN